MTSIASVVPRAFWTFVASAWVLLLPTSARAQSPSEAGSTPEVRFSIKTGAVEAVVPGRWSEIKVTAANLTDEPVDLLATTYIDPDSSLQYGRRFWVPAKARTAVWHPIRLPGREESGQKSMKFQSMLTREGRGATELITQEFGSLQQDIFARITDRERCTGAVDDRPAGEPGRITVMDFLMTAKYEINLTQMPTFLADRLLPPNPEGLDPLDHLVIADNRVADDPAGIAAVRAWLFSGGHLWIMFDRVRPELLTRLLGDEFHCAEVDRVGLTEVAFTSTRPGTPIPAEPALHELPVEHVRTIVDGVDVIYSVNGWPAALTRQCGRGRLLVTTLAADGWTRKRNRADKRASALHPHMTDYVPTLPLNHLSSLFFQPRGESPMTPAVSERHLEGFIGYQIPARGNVLGVLFGFTAALAAVGALLARRGRLEYLAVAVPVAAVLAGGMLLAAGNSSRSIPSTAAVVEFIEPMSGTPIALASGSAGMFLPSDDDARIEGVSGGVALPEMKGQEQTTRRLVWSDTGVWKWENLRAIPSVRFAPIRGPAPLAAPVSNRATFQDRGVTGRLALPPDIVPSDGLIIGPSGRMGVTFGADGAWNSTVDDVLAGDQLLTANVLDDEQNRRLQTLKSVLATSTPERPFASDPTLLFWSSPWNMGMTLSESGETAGSALVAIPITIDRPAPGSVFHIPSAWLAIRAAPGPDGVVPSGLYDNLRARWSEKATPTLTWLRFQPPEELSPFDIKSGRLTVDVAGPIGKLEIAGFDGREVVPIKQWIDPIGKLTLALDDPALFKLDARGGFFLRVAGGDPDRPELTRPSADSEVNISYWRIESLTLDLDAAVTPREPPAAAAGG